MKKDKIKLSPKEKRALQKKKDRRFDLICVGVVAATAVVIVAIVLVFFGGSFLSISTEKLYGHWYSEDGLSCWRFQEDGDVYFFSRKDLTSPYTFSSYTDFECDEKNRTVTVYFGKDDPHVFSCKTLSSKKLVLQRDGKKLEYTKGIDIAQMNKEIVALYPLPEASPSQGQSSPASGQSSPA